MLASPIEEIKNRLDIVDLVKEYVQLQKAGANYRGLCPLHTEKSPSFFVSPARQIWHCFGCGNGGDVFKFVMQLEGIEFGDALRQLAQRTGVELPRRDPGMVQWETERKRFLELLELAAKFFEKQLASTKGQEAVTYLRDRGLTEETTSKWRVGYAPDSARGLFDFLLQQGFREYEIGKAGLLVRAGNETYDRFRGRIMFPIFDLQSQVVGFGGRIFGDKEGKDLAKYLNTTNTPVYDKSKILYGLDKARLSIRKHDSAILVEGYFDVILSSQVGQENVIATSGTALTSGHLRLLKRYSNNMHVSFDRDSAGEKAAKRGVELALAEGFRTKVILMPEGKDPADMARENPQEWSRLIEEAKSVHDFYFETTLAKFDKNDAEGKVKIAEALLPVIKKLPSKIEQDNWIRNLAEELGVREQSIRDELAQIREDAVPIRSQEATQKSAAPTQPKTRQQRLEEEILMLLFRNPPFLQEITAEYLPYFSLDTQEILAGFRKNPDFQFDQFETIFPPHTSEFLRQIALRSESESRPPVETEEASSFGLYPKNGDVDSENIDEVDDTKEFFYCLDSLGMLYRQKRLEEIQQEIKKAESAHDNERLQLLLTEFKEISYDLHHANKKETSV